MIDQEEVGALDSLVRVRPTDLVLRGGLNRGILLHGEFDGYGDFFTLHFGEVEYIDVPGTFPVGGFRLATVGEASQLEAKWKSLCIEYSGQALIMWNADAATFEDASPSQRYLVVSTNPTLSRGTDWAKAHGLGGG